jgi:N-acyl-L-homoserine lactone synthetase
MSVNATRKAFPDVDQDKEKGFVERVAELLAIVDCRRADSVKEREAIFRLRYEAYLREGAILPNSAKTFSDPYDETENAYIFGLYIEGELASSLRLHVASREHPDFPSLEVFPDYLRPEVDAGKILIDTTRFVADERLSRLHRGLPYATIRICMLAGEYFHADNMLAAVRAEHQAFYRRAFNHRSVCEPRPYPQLTKPIALMTVHLPSATQGLYRRYPFFHSSLAERRRLFERPTLSATQSNREAASPQPPTELRGTNSGFVETEPAVPARPFPVPA